MSKFTQEVVDAINEKLNGKTKITYVEATEIADSLGISIKSLAPKLRSMGVEVSKKSDNVKKFTEQEDRKLQIMVSKGAFIEDIAEALGKTIPQIRGKLLHMRLKAPSKLGVIGKKTATKFWTEEKIKEAIELFNSTTETVDKLAERLGVSYPSFCKILKQEKIDYSGRKPTKTV